MIISYTENEPPGSTKMLVTNLHCCPWRRGTSPAKAAPAPATFSVNHWGCLSGIFKITRIEVIPLFCTAHSSVHVSNYKDYRVMSVKHFPVKIRTFLTFPGEKQRVSLNSPQSTPGKTPILVEILGYFSKYLANQYGNLLVLFQNVNWNYNFQHIHVIDEKILWLDFEIFWKVFLSMYELGPSKFRHFVIFCCLSLHYLGFNEIFFVLPFLSVIKSQRVFCSIF